MRLSTRILTFCLAGHLALAPTGATAEGIEAAVEPAATPARLEPIERPVLTARNVQRMIDQAVRYLRSAQGADGSVSSNDGYTALAALAMLAAGSHPASDAKLAKALDWLAKRKPNNTYVRGIRANVWEYALRKAPHDKRLKKLLRDELEWLIKAIGDRDGWRYSMQSRSWDNSCTQYGVLGIWAAQRAGLEVPDRLWKTLSKHFLACQNDDGGWSYIRGGSTPNMATAGLASLFLVFDMHHGKTCYTADQPRTFTEGESARVLAAIDRGIAYLAKTDGVKQDGYYLYGIERTAVAGGRKYIGEEDWFRRGATDCLRFRLADGSIPMGRWGGPIGNTAFCTMFLVYGGAPVAVSKLRHGEGADWNLNPRDLANLSKYLWSAYESPMNWQVVGIDDDPAEFESPILFISGTEKLDFTEPQLLNLREYIRRGGTILLEPADGAEAFAESAERLVRLMFPKADYPGYELRDIPAEHGIYTVLRQDWKQRPALRGVSDGSRTFLLVSDGYLSGAWQRNETDSDAFKLGMNLLFYATDLGRLEGRFATDLPERDPAEPRDANVTVARAVTTAPAGAPRDWDAAAGAWEGFAPYARYVTGAELIVQNPVALEQAAAPAGADGSSENRLAGIDLLHLTGRGRLELSESAAAALKQYVHNGGTVLIDAYAGSEAFAESAREQIEALFGELHPLDSDHHIAAGRVPGGADLSSVRLKLPARKQLRAAGKPTSGQKLLVAMHQGRPAVVFSRYDLSAALGGVRPFGAAGYTEPAARKIAGNLLGYLSAD